jgi:hypothetical protein
MGAGTAMGMAGLAASATGIGAIAGGPLAALGGYVGMAGTVITGATELWIQYANKYQAEMAQSFEYLSKNGTDILNSTV